MQEIIEEKLDKLTDLKLQRRDLYDRQKQITLEIEDLQSIVSDINKDIEMTSAEIDKLASALIIHYKIRSGTNENRK